MEIKEVATSPFLYATVASLAVLIIGALAYQKIGLLNNCAPVIGIIMMSVGAGILFFEGVLLSCQKAEPSSKVIQFFPPDDKEKSWTMSLLGDSRRLPFVLLDEAEVRYDQTNHFYIWAEKSKVKENVELWMTLSFKDLCQPRIIGLASNKGTLLTLDCHKQNIQECHKLIRDHTLEYQAHKKR